MTPPLGSAAAPTATWRLRRRLGVSVTVLSVVLTLLVAVVVVMGIVFAATSNEVIYRWQRGGIYTVRVLDDMVNQETGLRGYALTHNTVFLEPYDEYVGNYVSDTALLKQYVGSDPELRRLLSAFEHQVDVWHARIANPQLARLREGGVLTNTDLVTGKARFDMLRAASTRLSSAFREKSEAGRSARTTEAIVLISTIGVGVLVLIATGLLLWRGLRRWVLLPIEHLGAQTRTIADGNTYNQITPAGPLELVELGNDVEGMRRQIASQLEIAERTQEELRAQGAELVRSNEDLQQFAYVASHDLSEPLRKVANFCQLLERQYGDQLDDRAKQYIAFAVDGAKRMQALITDLLALSRVGRTTERFEPIDLDKKLDQALATLADRLAASGGRVERLTPLPVVHGDRALLISLLENLIGNALKYHRDDVAPVVQISAVRDETPGIWVFTVSDNGIGIDQEYAERIFAVFQRLHLRDQYGGTGIGLALCRRIVEFHGGQIWLADVKSELGATFQFTLRESGQHAQSRD